MKKELVIYYDPDCGFCKKLCERIQKYLLLKNAEIKTINSDETANNIFLNEYSWAVYDGHTKKYYSKSSAWWRLVRRSPFFFCYFITYIPFVIYIGDKIYDYIARNRPRTCVT